MFKFNEVNEAAQGNQLYNFGIQSKFWSFHFKFSTLSILYSYICISLSLDIYAVYKLFHNDLMIVRTSVISYYVVYLLIPFDLLIYKTHQCDCRYKACSDLDR